jgi:UPF0716 protein FxsA
MPVLFVIAVLPLLEIAGFVTLGAEIGLRYSLLWVVLAAIAGFYFLVTAGGRTLQKAKKSVDANLFPIEELFGGFCLLIGALLLIFPGFVSDFLALPLLVPPLRKLIFLFLKNGHDSVLEKFSRSSRGFTAWYYERGGNRTIDGDYRHIDDDERRR